MNPAPDWSDAELAYLETHYAYGDLFAMSGLLGRTVAAIRSKAEKRGLKRNVAATRAARNTGAQINAERAALHSSKSIVADALASRTALEEAWA